jgi:hypothetical protein
MKFFKPLLLKAYFDQGYAVTSYLKYLIAFFGLASRDVRTTLIIGFAYGISCFIIGWLWFKHGLKETETEIGNRYNPFVKEMRDMSGSKLIGSPKDLNNINS